MPNETETKKDLADLAPDANGKSKSKNVMLETEHFFGLTVRALEDRKAVLTKLAKDARGEGYFREVTNIEADANAIENVLLPRFRAQHEMPLVDGEKFIKAVSDQLAGIVRKAFAGVNDPKTFAKISAEAWGKRQEVLLRDLAQGVAHFASECAAAGHTHGYQARVMNADAIAASQLSAILGSKN